MHSDVGARLAGRPPRSAGRAAIGGLLVAIAAIGTFAAWTAAGEGQRRAIVVAGADLPAGRALEPGDLDVVAGDLPADVADQAFPTVATATGQVLVTPLRTGDVVLRSAVAGPRAAAAPRRQLSVALDESAALAGTLREGEVVDVLVTSGPTPGVATTEVAATGAQVAGIGSGDGIDGGQVVVLLGVPDDTDLLALATAATTGELTLVRRGPG